jgi:hypothetical protein
MSINLDQSNDLLKHAGWTRGREVVVNTESNTISVFQDPESTVLNSDLGTIPLTLLDFEIIPHPFPRPSPATTLPELATEEPLHNGLSNQHRRVLREIFPGLRRAEFYRDRIIVIVSS